jgi:N-acetylmuramoyl-L-alanine amidase
MSVIVVSKKAHYTFKASTVVLAIVAFLSIVMNIKMLTDVDTYKNAYAVAVSSLSDINSQLAGVMAEKEKLEKKVEQKKIAMIAASRETECLAKNIYFEAGREPLEGKLAVASVVKNRMKHPQFPQTACGVVYQGVNDDKPGCQFSWACDGMDKAVKFGSQAWADSKRIAVAVLAGARHDNTNGALFFHNDTVKPSWATDGRFTAEIGGHRFYR